MQQLNEATDALKTRRELRDANLAPVRPTEDALKKLDSSMKRNTGLVRKLKLLTEDSSKSILDDIAKANQSKYVSEAVSAVAEAPLKLKDIPAAVRICSALHQKYAEFSNELVPALAKTFTATATAGDDASEKPSVARKRATLRFLVELLLHGVYSTHASLLAIVRQIANSGTADFARNREEALACLSLMTAFAKAGREEILGLPHADPGAVPADLASRASSGDAEAVECSAALEGYNAELAQRWSLAPEAQAQFRSAAEKLLDAALAVLQSSHEALLRREESNERVLNTRGDLPESLINKFEAQKTEFEALERGAAALAEALERKLPEMQAPAATKTDVLLDSGDAGAPAGATDGSQLLFEDDESRAFYESLPNLRDVVPAVLLKGAAEPAAADETLTSAAGSGEVDGAEVENAEEGEEDAGAAETEGEKEAEEEGEETAAAEIAEALGGMALDTEDDAVQDTEESGAAGGKNRGELGSMLERLSHCVSKELCDEAAVEFCYAGGAGKGARKRLAKELCHVPAGALQLLPYYARISAVLAPLFPDIPAAVCKFLEGECRGLARRKDATLRTLEPRLRNARYIGELVKFKLFPAGTAFRLLKLLLDDFSGHNVDAACALVETAGRYLLRRADTTTRMTNMLEIMMKLKNAKNMDPRLAGLVDSTYYTVKATAQGPRKKERPPTHEWIRYLIYSRLDAASVPYVLKKLRRIKWSEDGNYVLMTILRASRKGRFSQLPPLASLAAGLAKWHPALGVGLVDAVLEEITAGMENPEASLYQRRVAAVRMLGELYNYKVANATLVLNTLHSLLAYGHAADVPPDVTRRLDPPQNFFRIRLVCASLESCGTFFSRGVTKKRLEDFLPYLQRYVLSKPPLPLDVDLDLQELYSRLKLTPPKYDSYEAACTAVAELEAKALAAAAAGLEAIEEEEEEEEDEDGSEDEDEESDGEEALAGEGEEVGGSGSDSDGSSDESASDSEDDSDREENDEDDDMVVREKTEAEEEFERELAAAMGESGASSGGGGGGGSAAVAVAGVKIGGTVAGAAAAAQPSETMALRVMLKKGARSDKTQELLIPVPMTAARKLREKEAAEAAERAEMKRMVLAANRRDEMEAALAESAPSKATGGHYWRGNSSGSGGDRGGRGGGGRGSGRGSSGEQRGSGTGNITIHRRL